MKILSRKAILLLLLISICCFHVKAQRYELTFKKKTSFNKKTKTQSELEFKSVSVVIDQGAKVFIMKQEEKLVCNLKVTKSAITGVNLLQCTLANGNYTNLLLYVDNETQTYVLCLSNIDEKSNIETLYFYE